MSKNFNEKKYLIIGAMILATGFLFGPATVKAATTIYFDVENQTISEGDTFVVNLKISTPDKSINVADGTILYDKNKLEIKEISTGGSLFILWPKPPAFSNDKGTLSFVGGISGGFQDKKGEVLKIIFLAKNKGEAKIDFLDGFSVFLNDGQGTQINPWLRPLSLSISEKPPEIQIKDEWRALVEKDKTPPEFVEAIINRDPHLFDNQYFVSFFAKDEDSGISYYEVKEGEIDFVRAESPHLLQDQSLKGIVQIKAVDKAGNESSITPELAPAPGIPYKIYLIWGLIILAILAFVFWLWRLWRRGWKFALFLGLSFILIFGAKSVNAATLYFSPSSGNFTVGNIFTVNVLVNTENADINNAEATVNFPSGLLEIISISKSGSAFSLWIEEPRFSNSAGTLSFNGGLPTPGFNGSAGKILSVVFRVKKAGSASLVFSSAAVRANDGYGTDVLRATNGASFNIGVGTTPQPPVASPKIEAPVVVSGFEISSSTHPDQNKWYSNNDPIFQFKFPSAAKELNLVLSRKEASTPQVKYIPPISEKILEDVDEGIWYLHANYRGKDGLSLTIKYKFQVDTGLPENFRVVRKEPNDTINPSPKYELRAEDSLSGIDRYEAKIDSGEWLKLSADDSGNYALHPQTPGKKLLTMRAYDKAGNYIELSQELQIDAPIKPAWYLGFVPILKTLSKGFDAIINFIINRWILLIILLVAGAAIGQIIIKGVPHFAAEIRKIRFIASEYHAQKKLKKLDSKTKVELKILEKDIKKELELLVKIANHRSLHPDEQYLKNKLERYRNIIKNMKG